jgi:hypothetical protein
MVIVRDVLDHYGGRLRLGRSAELGGFLAEVLLGVETAQANGDR